MARFIAPEMPALRSETSAARPLRLNTGRVRDQWHTMTRTGLSPRLGQHLPEPFVEVHPDDALRFGVTDGSFARVTTDYGQCTLKVVVSERQQRGMLFAPIHWSEANATAARVGSLVAPFTDPFSGQPENKATPASIAPYEFVFRGFALSRNAARTARACLVGARRRHRRPWLSARRQCRSRRAGRPGCAREAGEDLAEYKDFGGGVYRGASFTGDRIETCLFIGPAHDAGDWNVVKDLFAADTLTDDAAPHAAVGQIRRRPRQRRPDRLRLLRRRPHHDLRCDRSRRAHGRRDRRQAEGRHQLRLVHPGIEAADRADRRGAMPAAQAGRGELELSSPSLRGAKREAIQSFRRRAMHSGLLRRDRSSQ